MTFCAYPRTVSELLDRRARKKAQTREQIRGIAQRLFAQHGYDAVTIADVARQADVAVQTVFNHFATKEELFFDGRVPWVEGMAEAVRRRPPSVPPLTALREALTDLIGWLVGSMASEGRRSYVATVEASEALRAQERENIVEAERRIAAALLDAWSGDGGTTGPEPEDPATAAALTAAIWMSAVRVLVLEQRPRLNSGACPTELATAATSLAAGLLTQLEVSVAPAAYLSGNTVADLESSAHTGWPLVNASAV